MAVLVLDRSKKPLMPCMERRARVLLTRGKYAHGFVTGDVVVDVVTAGLKAGRHEGRVAIRAGRFFNITTSVGVVQGINYRHCCRLQRADGYAYQQLTTGKGDASSPA